MRRALGAKKHLKTRRKARHVKNHNWPVAPSKLANKWKVKMTPDVDVFSDKEAFLRLQEEPPYQGDIHFNEEAYRRFCEDVGGEALPARWRTTLAQAAGADLLMYNKKETIYGYSPHSKETYNFGIFGRLDK